MHWTAKLSAIAVVAMLAAGSASAATCKFGKGHRVKMNDSFAMDSVCMRGKGGLSTLMPSGIDAFGASGWEMAQYGDLTLRKKGRRGTVFLGDHAGVDGMMLAVETRRGVALFEIDPNATSVTFRSKKRVRNVSLMTLAALETPTVETSEPAAVPPAEDTVAEVIDTGGEGTSFIPEDPGPENGNGSPGNGSAGNGSAAGGGASGQEPAPSVVPLPAAGWLLVAGLGVLAGLGRRRKAEA